MPEALPAEPEVNLTPPPGSAASDQPAQNLNTGEAPVIQEGEQPPQKPTDEHPEKQGKNRFERRLDRAYRREAEAKAKADLLEKRLAEIEAKVAPKEQVLEGEPRIEQFDDIEKYAQAKAEFRSKKALEAHEAKQVQERQKQSQTQISQQWEERVEAASSKYDDWEDVVGEMKPTNHLTVAIMSSDNGDDVAYHLGKNLKEAQRIAGLDPLRQVLAIGALSAKLQLDPPKPKQPSKAPAPITPISGKESASEEISDKDDMKDFIRKREKQLGRRK
jgi:hypothetical protein